MMNPKQLKRLEWLKAEHQKVLAGRVIKYQALLSKCEELTADISLDAALAAAAKLREGK